MLPRKGGFNMKDKKKLLFVSGVVLLAAVLGVQYVRQRNRDNANTIRVSGNIEVIDAEVSFKIPGRTVERLVSEGETVKTGQIVARLDDGELVREVSLRRAEVQAVQAVLA